MTTCRLSAFSALFLCLLFPSLSQTNQTDSIHVQQKLYLQNGEVQSFDDWFSASEPNSNSADNATVGSYIVEFKEKPFFIEKKNNRGSARSDAKYKNGINAFKSDLKKVGNKHKENPSLKRSFHKTFYGSEVVLTKKAANELRKLPYVKQVYANNEVKAVLDTSIPLIMADSVWNNLGSKGEGVSIGIIDTGIDYMHPALGGGIGDSFKVKGGYDFVNDDTDPMDDHGHGTHCAGIAAGDGTNLLGVAPEASLYALKVLGAGGSGSFADVIAAIEWASDPNSDGDYSDHLDVLSLSLGGPGHPDDPQSVAVDNAVDLGIVVCVAAGNDGSYNTIGSPGTAESAITVGASNNDGQIGGFSSKGPNKKSFTIKPEIVAPGVDINSTVPGGGFEPKSGTSMATPHVAGAVALLKVLHPDWTPEQFKSALMVSATDLGYDPMAQGTGQINVFKAAVSTSHLYPAALSFGQASRVSGVITKIDTVQIFNGDTTSRSYSVEIGALPNGISLTASSQTFSVESGGTVPVIFQVDVVPEELGEPGFSGALAGKINFYSSQDTIGLPWSISPRNHLILEFDVPFPSVLISGKEEVMRHDDGVFSDDGYFLELYPAEDTLEIMMRKLPFFVFKEQVPVISTDTVTMFSSDATHRITMVPKTIDGDTIPMNAQSWKFEYPAGSKIATFFIQWYVDSDYEIFISELSSRFKVFANAMHEDALASGDIYCIQYPGMQGLSGDHVLAIEPQAYYEQYLELQGLNDSTYSLQVVFNQFSRYLSFGLVRSPGTILKEWHGKLYTNEPEPLDEVNAGISLRLASLQNSEFALTTPNLFAWEGGVVGNKLPVIPLSPDIFISPSGGTMNFGNGIIYPESSSSSSWKVGFKGKLGENLEEQSRDAAFKLTDENGMLIDSGIMVDFNPENLAEGYNKLQVTSNYSIAGLEGTGTFTATFNTNNTDDVVPTFSSFQIRNKDGVPADTFELGDPIHIRYSIKAAAEHSVFAKLSSDSVWTELPVDGIYVNRDGSTIGNYFEADLHGLGNDGPVDLKVIAKDAANNLAEWQLEPAMVLVDHTTPELSVMRDDAVQTDYSVIDYGEVVYGNSSAPVNISLINSGIDPLVLYEVGLLDTVNFDLAMSSSMDTLPASDTLVLTLTLTPRSPGIFQDTLTIASNHKAPFRIVLKGSSTSPEMLVKHAHKSVLSGSFYDFGDATAGNKYVYIHNIGNADLIFSGDPKVEVLGGGSSKITVNSLPLPDTIAPGASNHFFLQLPKDTIGTLYATLSIPTNDLAQNPYVIDFKVNIVTADINIQHDGADLVNNGTTIDFGDVYVGDSLTKTFTVQNIGEADLGFYSSPKMRIQGGNTADFKVDYSQFPSSIAPGGSANFTVTFKPTAVDYSASQVYMTVYYDHDEPNFKFNISGQGKQISPQMQFKVSITDVANGGTYDFGDVPIGSPIKWLYTYNHGDADLVLNGTPKVTFSGPDAADFGVSGTFADTIAPGTNSTEKLRFLAKTPGIKEATLNIPNNDVGNDPYQVHIRANMVSGDINIRYLGSDLENGNDQVDFGAVEPGQSSQPQIFVIENLGDGPLKFSSTPKVNIFGTNKNEFTADYSQMPYYLYPGDTTTFSITFTPSSVGQRSAYTYISVLQDWDESNFQFDLTGGVMEEPSPEMQFKVSITDVANGGTYDFGDVPIGSPIKWLYTYNHGDADLVLTGTPKVTFSGPDAADFGVSGTFADTIAPGTNSTEKLRFLAKTPGIKEATLNIPNNDTDNDPYQINIRAKMVSGDINVHYMGVDLINDSSTIDFGTVATGDTSEVQTFVIENLGDGPLKFNGGSKIWLQGTDYTHFAVDYSALPTFLHPGETTTFTITYLPASEGVKSASARIPVFYDWDEKYFTIPLTGDVGSTGARFANSSEQPKEGDLQVMHFPNPFEQTISLYSDYDATVTVQSLNGAEVDRFSIIAHEFLNYGADLPSGVYLFRLIRDNKTQRIIKVVKQ